MNYNKIRKNYELELIEQSLKDCEFEKGTKEYDVGKFLLVSLIVGLNADKIARYLKVSNKKIRSYAKKARENKIWDGRYLNIDWWDEECGSLHFILDTMVVTGYVERVYGK